MRLLQCPQILAYLGSAKTDTSLDLVYYDPSSVNATCTLDTLLARRGRLDVTACKSIAGRVCKGEHHVLVPTAWLRLLTRHCFRSRLAAFT